MNFKEEILRNLSLSRQLTEVFGVKVQYGDGDVVAEESNDVGRQRKQMKESRVVNAVVGAAERIPNQMRRCILINGL